MGHWGSLTKGSGDPVTTNVHYAKHKFNYNMHGTCILHAHHMLHAFHMHGTCHATCNHSCHRRLLGENLPLSHRADGGTGQLPMHHEGREKEGFTENIEQEACQ